jgi:hypothetical protein
LTLACWKKPRGQKRCYWFDLPRACEGDLKVSRFTIEA